MNIKQTPETSALDILQNIFACLKTIVFLELRKTKTFNEVSILTNYKTAMARFDRSHQ